MPVTLSDDDAALVHEALEKSVTLDTFDAAEVDRMMELQEKALDVMRQAVTQADLSSAAT